MEGFLYKTISNVFMFLGHFHMNHLNELVLGLCGGVSQASSGIGGRGQGSLFLVPSQILFHLKSKAIVGPFGYK